MTTKTTTLGLALLLVLTVAQPSQAIKIEDCETERMIEEALFGPDNVDSDEDGLSNEVEARLLETDPCNKDSDRDLTNDGYDAMPLTDNRKSGVPLEVTIVHINQIRVPDGCDDGTTWDPFFDGFSFAVPELGLQTPNLEAEGWTRADHAMNRPNSNTDIAILPTSGNGFTAAGNGITFDLDPNLSLWGDGFFPKLNLKFAGMIIDDDKNYDDSMSFGPDGQDEDVLYGTTVSFQFKSAQAVDADGGTIRCKAEIGLSTELTITDAIIEAYYELERSGGPSGDRLDPAVTCSGMNQCIVQPRIPPVNIPSPTVPYGAGTAGKPCDDPVIWNPYVATDIAVWSHMCEDESTELP